jgi:RHS repeat-associated protein
MRFAPRYLVALMVASLAVAGNGFSAAAPPARAASTSASSHHVVTLSQRRAEVDAQTAPARVATSARDMDFGRFWRSGTSRRKPAPPHVPGVRTKSNEVTRAGSASNPNSVYLGWDDDSWLTSAAGGVVSIMSDTVPANPVPGFVIGNVYPGEHLTVSDDVSLTCSSCFVPPDPSLQVSVSWEVWCMGADENGNPIDTVLVPPFGDVTYTTSMTTPPQVVQGSFTMPATTCSWGPPGGDFNTYIYVIPTLVVTSTGTTSTGQETLSTEFGPGGVPAAQGYGAPCGDDSADAGQSAVYRGDPVSTMSGECAEVATDALVNTPGYPLDIQRSYSSAMSQTAGPLGRGWTMPWFASLTISAATGNVTFNAENGSQYVFAYDDGFYDSPPGVRSYLEQADDGSGDYVLTTPDGSVLTFSAAGQLISAVDATGRGLTLSYTGTELTSVTDAAGQHLSLSYTSGLLTKITLPSTQTIAYAYSGGLLTSATVPGSGSAEKTSFAYTSAGLLSSITNPDGSVVLQNTCNSQGQVTSQLNGDGDTTKFSYSTTSSGLQETNTTEPDGGIWTDVYQDNVLMETIDPLGNKAYYSYNQYLEPVAVSDPAGGLTEMSYDGAGNLLSETDPLGNTSQWTYGVFASPASFTDPDGVTTSWAYNDDNQLTQVTLPNGNLVSLGYTGVENTSLTVPGGSSGETTAYAYNAAGQLTSVTSPGGGKTSYTYDAMGFPLTVTDPMGRVTKYGYLPGELLTTVTPPSGQATKYLYDAAGNVTSLTVPGDGQSTYAYTADGLLNKVTDPLGHAATVGYNGDGDQATYTDANAVTTTTSYNADDWPTKITYSDGTPTVTYGYDANGDTTSVTDGTGSRTMSYDADGDLTRQSGPGSTSFTYTYDAARNLTARTYPDGTSLSYGYTNGQVTSMTDGSAATSYTYNPAGNLSSTAMPDGVTATRSYNANGQLTSISDARGSSVIDAYGLTLNADGQPTSVAVTQDGAVQPAQYYGYNTAGQLASACATTKGSAACSATSAGTATGTAPNSVAGAPTNVSVTAGAGSATLTWTPPTGGSAVTGYVITASPGSQTATAGPYATAATIAGLTAGTAYTFTVTATMSSGSKKSAPTTAVTPGNETTYTYNAAGSVSGSETDGLTTTSTYNSGAELTGSVTNGTTTSYTYNADGEQTSAGQQTYSYNAAGELSKAVTPAGTFSYGYDASGDLATTSRNGSLIQGTTWDLNNSLPLAAEDTSATGTTTADYAWNPDGTLASMTTPSGNYQATTNWLGSVTGLVSSAGSQVSASSYSPYGTPSTVSLATGSPASSIGYAGSYTLPGGTGLDNMRARDYSPATAGFTSVDPLQFVTAQPYEYGSGDPLDYTDPSGLCSWYSVFCNIGQHWRGALQVTAAVAGIAAAAVCTAATDGLCGIIIEADLPAGFELLSGETALQIPAGSFIGGEAIDLAEGALDYGLSAGCHSWSGLMEETEQEGLKSLGEGAADEFVPFLRPSEGEHAVPANWWHTWSQFNPF